MFDEEKAAKAVQFLELMKLTGDFHGQPFDLMPWQRQIIWDVYGTQNERGVRQYRHVYVETAKKNAKSQLTSGIGNLHLYNRDEPNGQIVLCAGDREQAEQTIYNPLVEMIEQDKSLIKRVKITDSKKMIENKETGTLLKVISAESFTKHGWNISCCIFDELHVQPNRDLYDVMIKGAGLARRQPIWWVITTAGDDPDRVTIAWEVHEKAEKVLKVREMGDHEKDIPTWYPVIYSYPGEDIYNEANWKKANPSLGVTLQVDDLRDLAREARLNAADERLFRWLNLNQWITSKLTSWLPIDLFDSTVGNWNRNDLLGKECYVGGDFSTTTDLAGTALIFPPQDGIPDWRTIWDCWIPEDNMKDRIREDKVPYDQWAAQGWIIPTPGRVIDYTRIEKRFEEYKGMYTLKELPFDLSFAAMLVQRLQQEHGLTVVDAPQTYQSLTDPMNQLEVFLRKKMMSHENHPVARWCFGNTSISKNGNAQIKYVKERKGRNIDRTKRIDLTAAWVCGMMRARFYNSNSLASILTEDWGV